MRNVSSAKVSTLQTLSKLIIERIKRPSDHDGNINVERLCEWLRSFYI
jgi:hypothetical protein